MIRLRDAAADEADALERLQRRSSDVWEEYRQQLAANPDAIKLPQTFIEHQRRERFFDASKNAHRQSSAGQSLTSTSGAALAQSSSVSCCSNLHSWLLGVPTR